jgi:broad specificity phosphatase PhoE
MNANKRMALGFAVGLIVGAAAVNFLHVGSPVQGVGVTTPAGGVSTVFETPRKPTISLHQVAQDLKRGGYILYFRHPQRQKWDSVIAFDVYETAMNAYATDASYSAAVCLTPQGREEAKMIGKIFELAKVPVGAVYSSPVCRARQAAELAFGRVDTLSRGLIHTPVSNPSNAAAFTAELKKVLTTIAVAPGKNAVITAHGNTLENNKGLFATGVEFLGNPGPTETGFYVIKRDADGKLNLIQKFPNLADLAANGIDLPIEPGPASTTANGSKE